MTATTTAQHPLRDWVPATRTLLIGGEMEQPEGDTWDVFNPATEAVIATVGGASTDQVDAAVMAARAAFPMWSALSGEERARHIHRFADVLEAAADRLLPSIVNEVGTPVSLAEYLQVKMAVQEHRHLHLEVLGQGDRRTDLVDDRGEQPCCRRLEDVGETDGCAGRAPSESADHIGNAARAAITAASTWSVDAPPTVAMTASVAGLNTSQVSPSGCSISPPMSRVRVREPSRAGVLGGRSSGHEA